MMSTDSGTGTFKPLMICEKMLNILASANSFRSAMVAGNIRLRPERAGQFGMLESIAQ